jgi:hypothetical protein
MPSTDWKEQIAPDENERFERLASELNSIQKKRGATSGRSDRALHAKGFGVEAELATLGDLPDAARVGIFAAPATYNAFVRFSNGGGARQADKKGDVRGVAIKVLGVPGKKLIPPLADAQTQDFLLIRTPTMPLRTPDEFVALVRAAQTPALLPFRLIGSIGFGRTLSALPKLASGLSAQLRPVSETQYFSVLPIMWGKHAVKLTLRPRDPADGALPKRASPDFLALELNARLARGPVAYDLGVQFYEDEATTPIEDPTVEWATPVVNVARLTLPQQDPTSKRGIKIGEFIETLSFDPWHAPMEFRPLGAMMRARNPAYRMSTQERHAAGEPTGAESFE